MQTAQQSLRYTSTLLTSTTGIGIEAVWGITKSLPMLAQISFIGKIVAIADELITRSGIATYEYFSESTISEKTKTRMRTLTNLDPIINNLQNTIYTFFGTSAADGNQTNHAIQDDMKDLATSKLLLSVAVLMAKVFAINMASTYFLPATPKQFQDVTNLLGFECTPASSCATLINMI